jgi:hypothetical protein
MIRSEGCAIRAWIEKGIGRNPSPVVADKHNQIEIRHVTILVVCT